MILNTNKTSPPNDIIIHHSFFSNSEPLPVAETFTFRDVHGTSLGDVARLDTMITVVDGASFLDELHVLSWEPFVRHLTNLFWV